MDCIPYSSFRRGRGIFTPPGGGKLHSMLIVHTDMELMWSTHSATLRSALGAPGLTPWRKRGLPGGTRHNTRMEGVARNCSRCDHHVQPRHHMVDSTVPAGVFGVTRKDAHRWGSLPKTSGSRLHTRLSGEIAT